MGEAVLDRARNFILANARVLERHLFAFEFDAGFARPVQRALEAYRHDSGLFGYGLEPDKRASEPQPVDQAIAMEVLTDIGADPAAFLSICDGLTFLSNADGGLPFSHPTVRAAPHAPWWACDAPQGSSINPTGVILSYLWRNGVSHPWMEAAEAVCWQGLERLDPKSCHSIQNALAFLAAHPDRVRAGQALQKLRDLVRGATCFDVAAEGYVFSPLIFAPSPESPAAGFYSEAELRAHLAALSAAQEEDGGWPINWPPISAGVLSECRGIVTLRSLRILREYGRL